MADPITPPPELMEQWMQAHSTKYDLARQAAQWGADQELEACCKWIPKMTPWDVEQLRAARRPKPPSLKQQALNDLASIEANCGHLTWPETLLQSRRAATIRRALEALPDD
jgi:hypothetical protein